jgi:tetratricopeptide (TPR) repeat protein
MPIVVFKRIFVLVSLGIMLLWMSGCADLIGQMPAPPLALTSAEQVRVGVAAEARLIQLLGGPYHDKTLATDLKRLCLGENKAAETCHISVADRGVPALYSLPAGRIILTRGLLNEIKSGAELISLLEQGVELSGRSYEMNATKEMNEAIGELLSAKSPQYNPNAADIRVARLFKENACEEGCLGSNKDTVGSQSGSSGLPSSVKRLAKLQPGFELLAKGRSFEKISDEAQAIATYLQAAAVTPDEPRILRTLGMAYLRAGQLQSARLHLQKAVKLQPGYYQTHMGLGYLYLQTGQLGLANRSLAESVRLLPVSENLFLLAEGREKSGDIKGALSLYEIIADSAPNSKLGRTSASRLAQSAGGQ